MFIANVPVYNSNLTESKKKIFDDVKARLESMGLTAKTFSIASDEYMAGHEANMEDHIRFDLNPVLTAAYPGRKITAEHLEDEEKSIVLYSEDKAVACLTLAFVQARDSKPRFGVLTRFEAVHPAMRFKGIGRLLFDCAECVVMAGVADPVFQHSESKIQMVCMCDEDDPSQSAFARKLGFKVSTSEWGEDLHETAFEKELADYSELERPECAPSTAEFGVGRTGSEA
jgi:GNAT superfamily N-acetyltransferase